MEQKNLGPLSSRIRKAAKGDEAFMEPIWKQNEDRLGPSDVFRRHWWRHHNRPDATKWIVLDDKAFCHYHIRRDGFTVIYEIAVHSDHKRKGLAKALVNYLPRPITLKTDIENVESMAAYEAMGFMPMAVRVARSGKRMMIFALY